MDLSEMTKLEALQSSKAETPVRIRCRGLRHQLADALEAELPGTQFVQVYGHEHTHTDDLGYFCLPHPPVYASCGVASESEAIKIHKVKYLVHHVCALGKLGVVFGGDPSGWRALDLPREVLDLIVRWNDQHYLSFRQIAAALREADLR